MSIVQAKIHVAAVIETSGSLCVDARSVRGRSREIRARSHRLRLREPRRPGDRVPRRPADVTTLELIDVSRVSTACGTMVHVTGELDMVSTPVLVAALESALDGIAAGTVLAVDLSGVTFIGLHGVTLLLTATARARSKGAVLRVTGCPPRLHRLLVLTGVHTVLDLG